MPPLHERLRDTAEPDSESVIFGIVGSLFLLLPEAVRAQRYEVLLKDNGFCFLGALDAMSAADLQELGVVRGLRHYQCIEYLKSILGLDFEINILAILGCKLQGGFLSLP